MDIVVALSGAIAVGESTIPSKLVERWGGTVVKTRDALVAHASKRGIDLNERRAMQRFGDVLDAETAGRWVTDAAHTHHADDSRLLIIDAVRIREQIEELRAPFGRRLVHVHLVAADRSVLADRYRYRRRNSVNEMASYEMLPEYPTKANIDELGDIADVVLDTHRNRIEDIAIRCAAHPGHPADRSSDPPHAHRAEHPNACPPLSDITDLALDFHPESSSQAEASPLHPYTADHERARARDRRSRH